MSWHGTCNMCDFVSGGVSRVEEAVEDDGYDDAERILVERGSCQAV